MIKHERLYYHRLYQIAISNEFAEKNKYSWPLWAISKLAYMIGYILVKEIFKWKKLKKRLKRFDRIR